MKLLRGSSGSVGKSHTSVVTMGRRDARERKATRPQSQLRDNLRGLVANKVDSRCVLCHLRELPRKLACHGRGHRNSEGKDSAAAPGRRRSHWAGDRLQRLLEGELSIRIIETAERKP